MDEHTYTPARLSHVLALAKPYWHRYLCGALTIFAVNSLEMVPPAAVALFFNYLQDKPIRGWFPQFLHWLSQGSVLAICVLIVLAVGLQWVLRYLWRVFFMFTREYVASDLRRRYFQKLLRLPISFYTTARTGQLVSLASNDVDAVRMMMGPGVLFFFDAMAYFLFVGLLLASWHLELTLYLFAFVPFLIFVVRKLSLEVQGRFAKAQEKLGAMTACAGEAFAGISVVRHFANEEVVEERFRQTSKELLDAQIHLAKVQSALWPTMSFFVGLEALLVLWVGGQAVQRGELSSGEFVVFFLTLWLLTWPTVALGWAIGMYQRGTASLGRLHTVLEREEVALGEGESTAGEKLWGKIEVRHLSFRYRPSGPWVLQDVSFSIPPKGRVALVGPLGAGKSSLFQLLLRFYEPERGDILVGGTPLHQVSRHQWRHQLGYVPQEGFLFSATVKENIAFGLEEVDEERVVEAAKLAAIHEEILQLPQGYETEIGEKGVRLSGGQRQRLALARALAKRPSYLLLDDCLNGVDSETEERILQNLKDLPWDCTLIMATHRLTTLWDMSWIVVFERGRVVDQGSPEELVGREGWFRRTLEEQMFAEKL